MHLNDSGEITGITHTNIYAIHITKLHFSRYTPIFLLCISTVLSNWPPVYLPRNFIVWETITGSHIIIKSGHDKHEIYDYHTVCLFTYTQNTQTHKHRDGCYQTHYLPALLSCAIDNCGRQVYYVKIEVYEQQCRPAVDSLVTLRLLDTYH